MTLRGSYRLGVLAVLILGAEPAAGARYHVQVGGTRVSGPSTPEDWTAANCYATVVTALAASAPADSVLLAEETHVLTAAATLSRLISNRYLTATPGAAEIRIEGAGTLAADTALATAEIRGLRFVGIAEPRAAAALSVTNTTGMIDLVAIRGCTFRELRGGASGGTGGSALRLASPGHGATITIEDCAFLENESQGSGGAVWIGSDYTVDLVRSTFVDNRATSAGYGGALMVSATAALTAVSIEDCIFTNNASAGPGGALNLDSASLVMRRCLVQGSRSAAEDGAFFKEGAGLRVTRSGGHTDPVTVLIEDCEFLDNQGSASANNNAGDGGAILVKGADVTRMAWVEVTNCLFQGNTNAQGAGIYVGRFCQGDVRYCRFLDNVSWYQGGGAFKGGELPECEGELVTFGYCEFRGNRAGFRPDGSQTGEYSRGGGVGVRVHPRAHLYNCTFVDNRVNDYAYAIGDGFAHALEGGQWTDVNRCQLVNCAFWGQGGDVQVRSEGSGGMELVSHVAVVAGQMSVPGTTALDTVWLTSYPFASPLDLQPAAGSPLIDSGVAVSYGVDLAGMTVPNGQGFDIGCYEYHDTLGIETPSYGRGPLLTVSPNPFNPRTSLAFTLAESGRVRVAIHDPRGRLVRELGGGVLPSGAHELMWDGRDGRGRDVSAGVYLGRLQVNGRDLGGTKLSLVR